MDNASMDLAGSVTIKPKNSDYDTLQVNLMALPFKNDSAYSRVWLNGQEIRNVQSVDIAADVGYITKVTITFYANVSGVETSG